MLSRTALFRVGIAAVVAAAGFAALSISSAATFFETTEAENGAIAGNASIISDETASGDATVRFGSAGTVPYGYWVEPALVRISKSSAPTTAKQARLQAAKGEYESFQIALRAPAGGMSNVNVSTADLRNSAGGIIPKSNITLYREHFVNISPSSPDWNGSNRPGPAGLYADALIPFANPATGTDLSGAALDAAPFSVASGTNEVVWVDVAVPRSAEPGTYSGSLTVTSNLGNAAIPVAVEVRPFALPVTPAQRSAFLIWSASNKAVEEELLRNRAMPSRLANLADEPDLMSRLGLGAASTGFWSGADTTNCSMSAAPTVSQFSSEAARHAAGLKLYNYTADEIDGPCATQLAPILRQWAANMHQAGIDNLVTMPPDPAFFDDGSGRSVVDIWTILPSQHNAANIAAAINKGDEVWSYNALVQDAYSPKWTIDFAPIDARIQAGFINASLGYTGLLYWRVDRWDGDVWNNPNNTGYFSSSNYPGDGLLIYPGDKVGLPGRAVASMRLKQLRDGVEDYDYVRLLQDKGQGAFALQVSRSVGPDWTNWSMDPAKLLEARRQLGDRLSE
jgi:hypothetical protein